MTVYPKPLLDDADLAELTGLSQPSAQKRWLVQYRIPFTERADGRPRTTWGAVEAALGIAAAPEPDLRGL